MSSPEYPASINVKSSTLSDHSFIVASLNLLFNHGQPITVVRRHQWRNFNFDSFRDNLRSSKLLADSPRNADGLCECYDTTMMTLVDKHAPFADVKIRSHHNAPWYDDACLTMKCRTRRLDHIYRDKKSESA